MRSTAIVLLFIAASAVPAAQDKPATSAPAEFDVVSIKRHEANDVGGSMRNFPDGTFTMSGLPIDSIISSASPARTRDVDGLPAWAKSERYDVTVKPPPGSTREQIAEMWRTMFADRMKLSAHVEEREQKTFAMVLDRSDGRLGPNLKPTSLDCSPPAPGAPPRPPPPPPASPNDYRNRCGGMFGNGLIVTGATTMDRFVFSLRGLAGGEVFDKTGLTGWYSLELRYAPPRGAGADAAGAPDDAPEFLTAIREQLGLKLVPQKSMVPIFVVDHIERPSEN